MALCNLALCNLALCNLALCNLALCNLALCHLALCNLALCNLALCNLALCNLALCNLSKGSARKNPSRCFREKAQARPVLAFRSEVILRLLLASGQALWHALSLTGCWSLRPSERTGHKQPSPSKKDMAAFWVLKPKGLQLNKTFRNPQGLKPEKGDPQVQVFGLV